MARPSPSCAHDDDRLRLSPASPPSSNSAEKKESTVPRLSQLCPPCATPSSNSSLDYRRSDARIVEDGFAAISGVSKSAKVVLARLDKSPAPVRPMPSSVQARRVRIRAIPTAVIAAPCLGPQAVRLRSGRLSQVPTRLGQHSGCTAYQRDCKQNDA